jgi:hypothetical protein
MRRAFGEAGGDPRLRRSLWLLERRPERAPHLHRAAVRQV